MRTRRNVLITTAGLVAAGGTSAPIAAAHAESNPDAVLINDCIRFTALERQIHAFGSGPGAIEDDDARALAEAPIEAEQDILEKRICRTHAFTLEGQLMRVQAMLVWRGSLHPTDDAENAHYREDRLAGAVQRDLDAYLRSKGDTEA